MAKKKAHHKEKVPEAKKPRSNYRGEYDKCGIAWQFRILDFEGPWGWNGHKIDYELLCGTIYSKIKDFELTTWEDLHNGSHNVEVNKLCKQAQKRLEEIGQNDIDELFSLRLDGKKRIWGIKDRNILKVIWWDPEHEVCPCMKKHT